MSYSRDREQQDRLNKRYWQLLENGARLNLCDTYALPKFKHIIESFQLAMMARDWNTVREALEELEDIEDDITYILCDTFFHSQNFT